MLGALFLGASLALASESVQLLGPTDMQAPLPRGVLKIAVTLYDRAEGGRALWDSPAFNAAALNWRWVFAGATGPAGPAALKDFPPVVYAEFRAGGAALLPRHPFHLSGPMSGPSKLVFEPGAGSASTEPGVGHASVTQAPALRRPDPDDEAIDIGKGAGAVSIDPAQRAPAPARLRLRAGGEAPNLNDLTLSNNLYFQALREFRNGNTAMAVSKLDVALRLNPANSDARLALERIQQETEPAEGAPSAAPAAERARLAQELYFQALRDYAKGKVQRSRDELIQAAQLDPTDRGIAAALLHLRRELALVRSDGIH